MLDAGHTSGQKSYYNARLVRVISIPLSIILAVALSMLEQLVGASVCIYKTCNRTVAVVVTRKSCKQTKAACADIVRSQQLTLSAGACNGMQAHLLRFPRNRVAAKFALRSVVCYSFYFLFFHALFFSSCSSRGEFCNGSHCRSL